MRVGIVALAAVAALALGYGVADSAPAKADTTLVVMYWPGGPAQPKVERWTLRCRPAAGTHPVPGRACARIASLERPFAPIPPDMLCTQQYGGPGVALVTGIFRGQRIWARFNRTNGCHISRWNRLVPLLPAAGDV